MSIASQLGYCPEPSHGNSLAANAGMWPWWRRLIWPFEGRLRWAIAWRMHQAGDVRCWAKLAMWAMFAQPWRELWAETWTMDDGCTYCGHCNKPDLSIRELPKAK